MEDDIIKMYKNGVGSTTIYKTLGVSKRKVLKVLNENGLIVKKENPLYLTFSFKDGLWFTTYKCDQCELDIEISANKKYYLARNLKKKNICKPCSLENQKGSNNPFYGKTHTKETKDNISSKKKGVRTSYHMSTPEYRKYFSEMKKELWASGKMEDVRKKMSALMKKRIANGELKSYCRSKAEDEIIKIIKSKNIHCEPNFYLEGKIFDIYIPKFNLLIEYNGDYWHCNPKKYDENYYHKKKSKFAKEIWEYDKNKLYLAEKNDYTCQVIWESDYKKNKNIINELIHKYEKNC